MPILGHSGFCSSTPCRIQCYVPVTPVALCSGDVNPAFGLCLPSSYQGNLWLLDNCQESYREAPSCEFPSCIPKICTTGCDPSNSCVPCNSPTLGKVLSTCETTSVSPRPSYSPCTQAKGYVLDCYPRTQCASKTCQTFRHGSNCFGQLNCLPRIPQTLSHCRLGSLGYRSFKNLGVKPSAFSPSCYISSRCQPQYNLTRNCQYLNYGSMSCRPLGYFSRNFQPLSCIPSTFPPLRYLCSGSRPLNCY